MTSTSFSNSTKSASATITTTLTVTPDEIITPFSDINKPFLLAAEDSEARNWSFLKGDIAVDKFNNAITGFLTIFDALGSPVITEIVRKDFRWKTNGLRNSARRLRADSLRDLVCKELKSPPRFWAPSGIESLLWSHRILQFVDQLVGSMVDDATLELKEACLRAYHSTLALRHPHMTKVIFENALRLVPPRARFIANLSKHDSALEQDFEIARIGMKDFLRATRPHIEALRTLFELEDIEDPFLR